MTTASRRDSHFRRTPWGEPVPKTAAAAKKLAEKGEQLLERYKKAKAKKDN